MDNEPTNQQPAQDDQDTTDEPIPTDDQTNQSVSEYVSTIKPLQQQKRRKKILAVVIVVALISAAAVGGFFIVKNAPKGEPVYQPESSDQASGQQPQPISSDTTEYQSQQFFLSFKHPKDWEIVDERGSGQLTATSPMLDIPLEGATASGKVVLTIRQRTAELEEFEAGNALAVIDSERITYQNPSQAQRGETHLSFLSYAGSASSGLIDGIYITGDFGYKKDQAIPKVDISKVDPIIHVSFVSCDGACETAVAIPPSAWQNSGFGGQIKTMIQSLRVN